MPPDTTPIDHTIPPTDSAPVDSIPEAPEAPREAPTSVPAKDANLSPIPPEGQVGNQLKPEESPLSAPLPEEKPPISNQTAQIPPNEPLPPNLSDVSSVEIKTVSEAPATSRARSLNFLAQAKASIQNRKKMKLEKVMTLFEKHSHITNDEVEKLLHVSDATATRYLSILEKQGKILQSGKTGEGVTYSKI